MIEAHITNGAFTVTYASINNSVAIKKL